MGRCPLEMQVEPHLRLSQPSPRQGPVQTAAKTLPALFLQLPRIRGRLMKSGRSLLLCSARVGGKVKPQTGGRKNNGKKCNTASE